MNNQEDEDLFDTAQRMAVWCNMLLRQNAVTFNKSYFIEDLDALEAALDKTAKGKK